MQLFYFDGCPNWRVMEQRLGEAMREIDLDAPVTLVSVDTAEQAERWQFRGSPSLLLNGSDPFAEPSAPVGLSCRVFTTPDGLQGAPTVEQLAEALRRELPSVHEQDRSPASAQPS